MAVYLDKIWLLTIGFALVLRASSSIAADNATLQAVGEAYRKNHTAQQLLPANASEAERNQLHDKIWAPALQKMADDSYKKQRRFLTEDLPAESEAFDKTIHQRRTSNPGIGGKKDRKKPLKGKDVKAPEPPAAPKAAGRDVQKNDGPVEVGTAKTVTFGGPRVKKEPTALAPVSRGGSNAVPAEPPDTQPLDTSGAKPVQFQKK